MLREALETLVLLLSPFTPARVRGDVAAAGPALQRRGPPWPVADADVAREDEVELAVQVNGKVRGRITVPREARRGRGPRGAPSRSRRWREHLAGKEIVKVVVVPGRLVSVVVR